MTVDLDSLRGPGEFPFLKGKSFFELQRSRYEEHHLFKIFRMKGIPSLGGNVFKEGGGFLAHHLKLVNTLFSLRKDRRMEDSRRERLLGGCSKAGYDPIA